MLLLTGKEKNFVYSHLHPTGKVYQPHPKPVGVAFGGTPGNENIYRRRFCKSECSPSRY